MPRGNLVQRQWLLILFPLTRSDDNLCFPSIFTRQQISSERRAGQKARHPYCTNVDHWFPRLLRLLTDHLLVIPKPPRTLTLLFNQGKLYPLQQTLILLEIIRNSLTSKGRFGKNSNCQSRITILEREQTQTVLHLQYKES